MTEKYVQVPVSLIERIEKNIQREYGRAAVLEFRDLFSQPPPTAEPDAASKLEAVRELARKARWGCERWADPLPVPQYVLDLEAILDPFTIRYVQPPKHAA